MAINKKALDVVINGKPGERVYLCGKDFSLFFVYYFSEYIKYPFADFHYDFFDDIKKLEDGTYREVAWIGFRECSKTSFAKIYITWLILYKKKKYINVDSYSTVNAERILFDVILNLQTNKLIISDFGHLYNAKRDENETTQKRVNNFITNNGVRVEAHSTGRSVRGRLHGNQRPDCHVIGTRIFDLGKWMNVEEHPSFPFAMKDIGKDVQIHSLPYVETVTKSHRYWTRYIPLVTVKNSSNRKQKIISEGWEYATNLTKNHYIGYKIDKKEITDFPKLDIFKPGNVDSRNKKGQITKGGGAIVKKTPKEFYDKDWWWLFGLWWGDGHLSGKYNNDSTVGITIANKDEHIKKRVIEILEKSKIKYSITNKVGCFQLTFSNAVLGRWLRTWRIGNSMKKPPEWVENISIDFQKELIKGYIDADGYIDIKNNNVRITSVYLDGLLSARRILSRIGIPSSIRNGIDGNDNYEICGVKCKTKKKYDLRFRENANILNYKIKNQTRYTYPEVFIDGDYMWSKIKNISTSEEVYFCPIQTNTHDYLTDFGISHNCLLLDDFETNDTKDSKIITEDIIEHINEFKSGLDSTATILYLGNLITETGSIATLYERAKVDPRLKVRQIDAETPDGKPTWPQKYVMTDIEADVLNKDTEGYKLISLEDKKRQLGSLVYSAEMMNQPVSSKSGIFKKEMFKYIKREDVERKNTRKFATIDSALSKDANSDATGVVRNYVDDQNFWYISARAYRINPKGLIELIFQLYDEGMEKIGIETTTFTQAIQPFFEDECRKRGKYPRIIQLKHGGVMKETRIEALVPYYESRSIYHIEGECDELEMELFKFPMAKHDDLCPFEDTLILTNKGDVRIKDIKVGDMVLTRNGYKPVIAHAKTGTTNILTKLNLSMTPNHKVYTERGWISLEQLNETDIITVCEKQLLGMGLSTKDIQNLNKKTTGFIIKEGLKQVWHTFIGIFGLNKMVKYLKGFIYTILMKIHRIMKLKTLNLLVQQNTQNITKTKEYFEVDMYRQIVGEKTKVVEVKKTLHISLIALIVKNLLEILKVIHLFIVGMFVKQGLKEKNFLKTKKNKEKSILKKHIKNFLVRIVESILKNIHIGYTTFALFVGKKEDILKDINQERKLSKQNNVYNVERIFKVRYSKLAYVLKNVKNKGHYTDSGEIVDVYNFEVQGCKEYFANGILVHNCDALQYQRFIAESSSKSLKPKVARQSYTYNPRNY